METGRDGSESSQTREQPVRKPQSTSPDPRESRPQDALLSPRLPELFSTECLPFTLLSQDALCGTHSPQARGQGCRMETQALSGLIS